MQTKLNFQDDTDKFGKLTKSSGKKCIEKANRLPVGSWARKFVTLLIQQDGWVSTKCKLTWKLKGTKYNRFYFQIYPSLIEKTDLLPTPKSVEAPSASWENRSPDSKYKPANGLLPTPKVSDVEGGVVKDVQVENGKYYRENKDGVRWGVKLRDVVETQIMPTPTATDYKGAYPPASIDNFPQRRNMIRNVYQYEKEEYDPKTCQLSPQFVLEMMGFPTDWTLIPFQKQ